MKRRMIRRPTERKPEERREEKQKEVMLFNQRWLVGNLLVMTRTMELLLEPTDATVRTSILLN